MHVDRSRVAADHLCPYVAAHCQAVAMWTVIEDIV